MKGARFPRANHVWHASLHTTLWRNPLLIFVFRYISFIWKNLPLHFPFDMTFSVKIDQMICFRHYYVLNDETHRVNLPYWRVITVSYYTKPKVKMKMRKGKGREGRRVRVWNRLVIFLESVKAATVTIYTLFCIMRGNMEIRWIACIIDRYTHLMQSICELLVRYSCFIYSRLEFVS